MSSVSGLDPSAVLAAYAEPVVVGRRVIVFGNALSELARHLLERGARMVHVYDSDPGRVAQAATQSDSKNVAFAPLGDGGLAVREGAFDVGIVENLAAFEDARLIVDRLRRALAARGVALVVSENPDVERTLLPKAAADDRAALDYYALYDVVAQQFAEVRMLGQAPFVGYAVVDFSPEDEPEPTIDSSFLGAPEESDFFIALASAAELRLDEFSVVQLPWRSVIAEAGGAQPEHDAAAELAARDAERRSAEAARAEVEAARAVARAEVEAARADAEAARAEVEAARAEVEAARAVARAEVEAARVDAAAARAEIEAGRAESETARAAASRAEARAAEERAAERAAHEGEIARLKSELQKRESWIAELEARANTADERADATQAQLEKVQQELAAFTEQAEADPEQARLEAQLVERGQEIRRLQKDLAEAERIGRELVREVEMTRAVVAAPVAPPAPEPAAVPVDLQQKLEALARLNAEREADLAATRWALQAVEARAELVAAAESRSAELERELEQLRLSGAGSR